MSEQINLKGATYREIVRIIDNKHIYVFKGWVKDGKVVKWAGGYIKPLG
ncbi:MAG: hypothetical protein J7K83_00615 [Candidatus Aenigmarchaeota archaeon]|nr:hypothetical protein [Candidatus Aenigmarchaeota archaeon]